MSQPGNTISFFEDMAVAIAAKHLANIKAQTAVRGSRPDFDELMVHLKHLEQELTQKGLEFVETYSIENTPPGDITPRLKETIRKTIEGFIKLL